MIDNIKLTYFDLRAKGEAARLLMAYSGLKWEDDRVVLPSIDFEGWKEMKTTLAWGQLPCLTWNGERLCQSMSICRFLAREMGIAGRNSLEMAQVDEIVDVIPNEGMDRALQTIEEEIEDLIINHNVPSENIVVAGASQGGVLRIWCVLYCKRKLGGFLPIVTWLPLRKINDITQISPPPINKDTPIMHMNGLLDPIVPAWPAAKKTEEEMEKVFTNYELKLVPGTHGTSIGPHTTPLMVRWAKKNTNLKFSNWNPIAWIPGRK